MLQVVCTWLKSRSRTGSKRGIPSALLRDKCVCFVDAGVAPGSVAAYLDIIRPALVIYQHLPTKMGQHPWPIREISQFNTVGGYEDEELALAAESEARRLIDIIAPCIPGSVGKFAEIDLVTDILRPELQGLLLKRRRIRNAAESVLEQESAGVGLLIQGSGGFTGVLKDLLLTRLGSGQVFSLDSGSGVFETVPRLEPVPGVASAPEPLPVVQTEGLKEIARHAVSNEEPDTTARPCLLAWPLRNHAMSLAPVVRELASHWPIEVLALSGRKKDRAQFAPFERLAETHPLVCLNFDMAPTPAQLEPAVLADCRAAALVATAEIDHATLLSSDVMGRVIRRDVLRLVGEDLPRIHGFAFSIDAHFARARPAVVVISRERGWQNRTGALVARGRGIPTLLVQASMLARSARHVDAPADYATVFDTYAAKLHADHLGIDRSRITMTGFPSFDPIRHLTTVEQKSEGIFGKPHVLLAMQRGSIKEDERFIRAVMEALQGIETSARVTIKVHPKSPTDTIERYRQAAARHSTLTEVSVVADGNIFTMLQDASVVVSGWSTILLEAALCGTPSLSVTLDGRPPPIPFADMGVAHEVHSASELASVLPQLLRVTKLRTKVVQRQRAYLEINGHLMSGPSAATRIAQVVLELAKYNTEQF